MKIVALSDVHTQWKNIEVPECDILVSAGDYSDRGEFASVKKYHELLYKQPARHIISVQGNHEIQVEINFLAARGLVNPRIHFIDVGIIEIEGLKIFCSAVTPEFCNWAYGMDCDDIKRHWSLIPKDADVLVTHGPAYGILDQIKPNESEHLGCRKLLRVLPTLKKLKAHIFGHIHGSSGVKNLDGVQFINAAVCDENYKPVNPVRIIEI